MPRPLVIGNSKMLINFDDKLRMRDLYYPYVGQLNHVGDHYCKIGIWVDEKFNWLEDDDWKRELRYQSDSLVTNVHTTNDRLQLDMLIEDGIHQRETIYLRLSSE